VIYNLSFLFFNHFKPLLWLLPLNLRGGAKIIFVTPLPLPLREGVGGWVK
jgi:hypothetical protein